MRTLVLLALSFFIPFSLAVGEVKQTPFEKSCKALERKGQDAERLHSLFKLQWKYYMTESPEWATYVGYPGQNGRWTDQSIEAISRRKREALAPLKVLKTITRAKLKPADQLNYDLFRHESEESIEGQRFPGEYLQITQMGGIQQSPPQLFRSMSAQKKADFDDMLLRLKGLPTVIGQVTVLLKEGVKKGITPPQVTLGDVPGQILNLIPEDGEKSPLIAPFLDTPPSLGPEFSARLKKEALAAYRESVRPAYLQFHAFVEKEYLPNCRKTLGLSSVPDGEAWYAFAVRTQTTTKLSPKEIHEIGLSEVKRIRGEMEKVIREANFKGDFNAFLKFLRTDKQFYYQKPEQLLAGYRDICKRADPELAKLFGKLPRNPYGVKAVPAYAEKNQTTAYYEGGAPSTGRPGYFYANTYDLKSRPSWEMEALALHEAVPGHHLQISLAQEMEGVPEFRKHSGYTAYVEGWGLYSESLGGEMGFYKDPYSKFGQLTYEIWRAIRLVVDTGMHSLGWSREKAIQFFLENAAKTEHDIKVEVDRYIVWPGQALAYKIGELKIKELRRQQEQKLGEKFDVRAFHDTVLKNGALPLDLLVKQF